jgi:hypothetical protein
MKKFLCFIIAFALVSKLDAQTTPSLFWAKQQSGSSGETAKTVVVDALGNSYILGFYSGTMDLDPGPGVVSASTVGSSDVYLVKLDPNGNFVWGRSYGSSGADEGTTLYLDNQGMLYATGFFLTQIDFSSGAGTLVLNSFGDFDAFLLKIDTAGNEQWAKQLGGFMGIEEGRSVVADDSSNVYLAGLFTGTADFDPSNNMFQLTAGGGTSFEGFVVKLDANGNLVWAKQLGGTNSDLARNIAINSNGDLFVTGTYRGTADFDPGAAVANLTSNGADDIFIVKLDRNGNFGWAKSVGGNGLDLANGIAVDSMSNVITIGQFLGNVDFDPGAGSSFLQPAGFYDSFVLKLDSSGNFIWVKRVNSTSNVNSRFVKTDQQNNIYITGGFTGTMDVNPDTNITQNVFNSGSDDVFILKLNENGIYNWSLTAGGLNFDQATSLEISDSSYIYISGSFNSSMDFDPTPGVLNLTPTASRDAFIAKYSNPTTTSLFSISKNDEVSLYPNPTNHSIILDLKTVQENIKYSIHDMSGKLISTENLSGPTSLHTISLDRLENGVYILSISNHQFSSHQRIIKQ